MRVDALIPLTHTAEYWDYTVTTDPDSNDRVVTYYKAGDIKVMISEQQGITLAFAREYLAFDAQLRNVRDSRGNVILDGGPDAEVYFFIGSPTVQFDVYGNVMGYKYSITKRLQGVQEG